ncbi:MAG TPA: 3'-5' exonuclease [Bacteroidales bacterium]|nr:3'-5' exonuclease [Bacteroidales bacterium]HOM41452.1 3'-5' exonuclease [Bacteroidales bacterium]HPP93710.1 3'-5' exonuclease [Bacteroidales bacterium]
MELKLKRPLAFIDLETTGTNIIRDRIVEISVLKISPGGKEEWFSTRVNPEMPVPVEATAVHGITDEDVAGAPRFAEIAKKLADFLEGCDLAGYNANRFDIPLLAEEFLRVNIDFDFRRRRYVDVQVIFHKKEQRTLSAAYLFYCRKELEDAHSSKADTQATYEILKAQLERYPDLENDVKKLAEFSSYNNNADFVGRIIYDEQGREVFNFGKYKGRLVEEVLKEDPAYYSWMMNGEFSLYTKKVLTEIKLRQFGK